MMTPDSEFEAMSDDERQKLLEMVRRDPELLLRYWRTSFCTKWSTYGLSER